MIRKCLKRSFNNGFVFVMLLGLQGCGKSEPPAATATPQPKGAMSESAIVLPEFHGLYAVEDGMTKEITCRNQIPNPMTNQLRSGAAHDITIIKPNSEFLLFEKRVALTGASSFRILRCDYSGSSGIDQFSHCAEISGERPIEIRTKSINNNSEILRIVPARPLEMGVYDIDGLFKARVFVIPDEEKEHVRELQYRELRATRNLQLIGTGLKIYAYENRERYPPDLDTLVKWESKHMDEAATLISPMDSRTGVSSSIVYVSGLRDGVDNRVIVAYEDPAIYEGRCTNVLFPTAYVELCMRSRFEELLRQSDLLLEAWRRQP